MILPVFLVMSLSVVSYASNVPAYVTSTQAVAGYQFNVTGYYNILSGDGLQVVGVSKSASPLIAWSNGAAANTVLTMGHWQYALTVMINEGVTPNAVYTVLVESSGGLVGSIDFMSPAVVVPGEKMFFVFDVGATVDGATAFVCSVE